MKLVNLMAVMFSVVLLSACSGNPFKKGADTEAQQTEVAVEHRDATTTGIEGDNADGGDISGAEAQVIVDEEQFQGDEIDDPDSPLSNRVVYFEYDSIIVTQEDQEILAAHAEYLGKNRNVTVRLEGHTDDRGSREYNLALGERRALTIRQILMLHGASINQFQITSFGEESPAVESSHESSWQLNRRVELKYVGH